VIVLRTVDTRDQAPPEPLHTVLDAVRALPKGVVVLMRHRREPSPLYALLAKQGLRHHTAARGDSLFEIFIWRSDDDEAAAFVAEQESGAR